jgi:putative salt-induced outer membrane protein YdiY
MNKLQTIAPMKYHVFIVFSSFLSLLPSNSHAQIAHIMDSTEGRLNEGLSSKVELSLEKKSGNSSTQRLIADGGIFFKQDKNLYLLIAKRDYGEQNDTPSSDSAFLHARYRRFLTSQIDFELFTQIDTNKFKRRERRNLIGTGPRFKLLASDRQNLTLGIAPMLEHESYTKKENETKPRATSKTRISISSGYDLKIAEPVTADLSVYYQPNIETAADFRMSLQAALAIRISTNLSFRLSVEQTTDSMPPSGTKKTDTITKQSFVLNW